MLFVVSAKIPKLAGNTRGGGHVKLAVDAEVRTDDEGEHVEVRGLAVGDDESRPGGRTVEWSELDDAEKFSVENALIEAVRLRRDAKRIGAAAAAGRRPRSRSFDS